MLDDLLYLSTRVAQQKSNQRLIRMIFHNSGLLEFPHHHPSVVVGGGGGCSIPIHPVSSSCSHGFDSIRMPLSEACLALTISLLSALIRWWSFRSGPQPSSLGRRRHPPPLYTWLAHIRLLISSRRFRLNTLILRRF